MSDKGYAVFVFISKYVFLNLLASVAMVILARAGWLNAEDSIVLYYLIINCTALIMGKLQKILDSLQECRNHTDCR